MSDITRSEVSRSVKFLLLDKAFTRFLTARFLLTLGMQIQLVAVSWQIYALTKDPLALAMMGLSEAIAAIGFALLAGDQVDRGDARRWMIASSIAVTVQACILLTLSIFAAEIGSHLFVMGAYVCLFLWGTARAFIRSSTFALFGELVPRRDFVRAEAMSSSSWQISGAVGPAAGGLLYGFCGPSITYAISALCFLASMILYIFIGQRKVRPRKAPVHWRKSMLEGFRFVLQKRVILSAISLDLFAVLFGGSVALLPMFADRLGVGPEGLGWMRAAQCMGAIPVVLFLSHRPLGKKAGRILLLSVAAFGLCWIAFAFSKSYLLSLGLLIFIGAFDAVSVVLRGAISQVFTPDDMRGRVSAINGVFISSSNEIGAVESGTAAKVLGAVPAVVFGGVITILVVAMIGILSKELRELDLTDGTGS